MLCFFFFQEEAGIEVHLVPEFKSFPFPSSSSSLSNTSEIAQPYLFCYYTRPNQQWHRSEERRGGKEGRSPWSPEP